MAQDSDNAIRPWRAPVLLALAVIVADQLSKHWAVNRLSGDRIIDVVWTLRLNLAFNSGMAFSRGEGLGPVIAVVATLVIVWLLVSLRTAGGRLNTFGIGAVIGGAAGNLIDRAFRQEGWLRGSVVDFIDFQWFPIFNIADSAINVGAAALILNALIASRQPDPAEVEVEDAADTHEDLDADETAEAKEDPDASEVRNEREDPDADDSGDTDANAGTSDDESVS